MGYAHLIATIVIACVLGALIGDIAGFLGLDSDFVGSLAGCLIAIAIIVAKEQ